MKERSDPECPPRAHSFTRITADTMGLWGWVTGCPHSEVSWSQLEFEGSSHFATPLNIPLEWVGQTAIPVGTAPCAISASPCPTVGLGDLQNTQMCRRGQAWGFSPASHLRSGFSHSWCLGWAGLVLLLKTGIQLGLSPWPLGLGLLLVRANRAFGGPWRLSASLCRLSHLVTPSFLGVNQNSSLSSCSPSGTPGRSCVDTPGHVQLPRLTACFPLSLPPC